MWRVPHTNFRLRALRTARFMTTTSLQACGAKGAVVGAEQSHYLEVMLRARIWPPVARHACQHHRAHLSCTWQPSALPPSFTPPSLHVLGSMSESCVPAAEDNVCRRDVSPYGCEDVILCYSTRESRQRRSPTPHSAREARSEQSFLSRLCNMPFRSWTHRVCVCYVCLSLCGCGVSRPSSLNRDVR